MTQVDPNPQAPQQSPQAQSVPVTEADLWQRICAQASVILERQVRPDEFPIGHLYAFWKGEPNVDGSVPARGVTLYERGKPAPIKSTLGIFAMFGYADDFVRVYAIPIDASAAALGPARITLSRTAPVPSAFVEYMQTWDKFVTEIAAEIANDLDGTDDDSDEDEEIEDEGDGDGFTST